MHYIIILDVLYQNKLGFWKVLGSTLFSKSNQISEEFSWLVILKTFQFSFVHDNFFILKEIFFFHYD